jgi:pimeloyl-ACP methyl ester carboxylesterase
MTDITIINGSTKLAASIYGPPDAEPILFLHGISLSRDTWEEIAQRLSSGYRVWTLDFRGHGHSDRASSYELADYMSDAETALAAIGRPAIVCRALTRWSHRRCFGPNATSESPRHFS